MSVEIKVPEVGESITEGVLLEWHASEGDLVDLDQPLFELETDKVTMTVNAEAAGTVHTLVEPGATVEIGQVVARIEETDGSPDSTGTAKAAQKEDEDDNEEEETGEKKDPGKQEESDETETPPARDSGRSGGSAAKVGQRLSPAVRKLLAENQLEPSDIEGTGRNGRITSQDVRLHLDTIRQEKSPNTDSGSPPQSNLTSLSEETPAESSPRTSRRKMSSLRKRIAERLLESQHTSATLTTFNEADLTRVLALRSEYSELYREKFGVKLGFMSFFIKSAVVALREVPSLNSYIDGDEIVENHFYDIGVAVATEQGLVVPVIRHADRLTFAQLEKQISDLAGRARDKDLKLEDLKGGSFTITNGGIFGSLLSTPILNPPQSGILGMHTIQKRPIAIDDEIQIRPMMYLALSYDHRLVDGREAVTFLRRVVDCIERPERLMLEI